VRKEITFSEKREGRVLGLGIKVDTSRRKKLPGWMGLSRVKTNSQQKGQNRGVKRNVLLDRDCKKKFTV